MAIGTNLPTIHNINSKMINQQTQTCKIWKPSACSFINNGKVIIYIRSVWIWIYFSFNEIKHSHRCIFDSNCHSTHAASRFRPFITFSSLHSPSSPSLNQLSFTERNVDFARSSLLTSIVSKSVSIVQIFSSQFLFFHQDRCIYELNIKLNTLHFRFIELGFQLKSVFHSQFSSIFTVKFSAKCVFHWKRVDVRARTEHLVT